MKGKITRDVLEDKPEMGYCHDYGQWARLKNFCNKLA